MKLPVYLPPLTQFVTSIAVRAASPAVRKLHECPTTSWMFIQPEFWGSASAHEPNASWPRTASIANFQKSTGFANAAAWGGLEAAGSNCQWLPRWPFKPSIRRCWQSIKTAASRCPSCWVMFNPIHKAICRGPITSFTTIVRRSLSKYRVIRNTQTTKPSS